MANDTRQIGNDTRQMPNDTRQIGNDTRQLENDTRRVNLEVLLKQTKKAEIKTNSSLKLKPSRF